MVARGNSDNAPTAARLDGQSYGSRVFRTGVGDELSDELTVLWAVGIEEMQMLLLVWAVVARARFTIEHRQRYIIADPVLRVGLPAVGGSCSVTGLLSTACKVGRQMYK